MRTRWFSFLALAALIFVAGCERTDVGVFTVEGDEPGYRRAKDLIKQARNQEALSEFLKVIEKRGLDNSPESHLEVGLLYQFHIKDPVAAIFHYKKFRELKPNSPQADLVRQRIDAATRDFAKNVLGNSFEKDLDRLTSDDLAKRLQVENDRLKSEIASLRAGRIVSARDAAETPAEEMPAQPSPVAGNEGSPVQSAPVASSFSPVTPVVNNQPVPVNQQPRPTPQPPRPGSQLSSTTRPAPTSTTSAAQRPTSGPYRRHVIAKGDTLYSLAQKYYGNKSRWKDIYAANRDVMRTQDDYKVGMELKIPY